jgi:hypothetical protein
VLAVEKRKLNLISTLPGMTLVAPVPPWMLEICQVVGGKYSLPSSQTRGGQFGHGRRGQWIGFGQMRVGDVALDALDRQLAGQRAAPAVLDHVAERVDRGRFADDAEVEHSRRALQRLGDGTVPSVASPSSSEVSRKASEPGCGWAATKASVAVTKAASEDFMSAAPRP